MQGYKVDNVWWVETEIKFIFLLRVGAREMTALELAFSIQHDSSSLNLYYRGSLYQMCPNFWHTGTQRICRAWELHNEVTKNNAKQIKSHLKQAYSIVLRSILGLM